MQWPTTIRATVSALRTATGLRFSRRRNHLQPVGLDVDRDTLGSINFFFVDAAVGKALAALSESEGPSNE